MGIGVVASSATTAVIGGVVVERASPTGGTSPCVAASTLTVAFEPSDRDSMAIAVFADSAYAFAIWVPVVKVDASTTVL